MRQAHRQTSAVAELLLCFAGPLLWALHLFVLYGGVTLACLSTTAPNSTAFQAFALVTTLLAVAAIAALIGWQLARMGRYAGAGHRVDGARFLRAISILLALAGLLAIVWGVLPVLVLPTCPAAA
jgi:hypothetical protein